MSNLAKTLERFKADIKSLAEIKKAKAEAKTAYDKKRVELDKLTEPEIKKQGKKVALENIADLKTKQNNFRNKNNEYADTLLKVQGDFEETYSTVLHSLVDTVYDARKMMHYLATAKDHTDSDFVKDKEAINAYLQKYTTTVKFDETTINGLISEAKKLTKFLNSNERKKLMNAFARHEKEDLKNLLTFIQKRSELEEILKDLNLSEKVDKLPTADEVITNYARFIPQIYDAKEDEELSMNDALNVAFSAFFPENEAKKSVEFKRNFEISIMVPLYADPIIVVSFDFKLEFEFKAEASATASSKGSISSVSIEAKCSVSFGVSVALSLRIIQLIKASINAGIFFETSIGAKAELKNQIAYFGGEAGLSAESKLIAKTWISLSICGPVSLIIEAATGKKPELRWMMGELALFKLALEKKAELKLDPMGEGFKAEANFRPLRDGFTVEFIGKEEIKRKLNEKYNNKLAVIKQQFLSNDEMMKAHDDKVALLKKFDVLDFDAGDSNNDFKKKVQHRTSFM
ncbi:MAG: hypothetical protein MK212_15620, partial [Saprospiraceae bacterium]|nr:hypothetical protein [Saprospiraceae bacterium]